MSAPEIIAEKNLVQGKKLLAVTCIIAQGWPIKNSEQNQNKINQAHCSSQNTSSRFYSGQINNDNREQARNPIELKSDRI